MNKPCRVRPSWPTYGRSGCPPIFTEIQEQTPTKITPKTRAAAPAPTSDKPISVAFLPGGSGMRTHHAQIISARPTPRNRTRLTGSLLRRVVRDFPGRAFVRAAALRQNRGLSA